MPEVDARTLDLHGLTWTEAQAAFIDFYNSAVHLAGGNAGRLDVVHGYGSTGTGGVLRTRLRGFLDRHKSYLEFQPGENVDGNRGHTIVVPLKPLPSLGDQLVEEIWAYCERPRAQSKIIGKFRRHGEIEVLRAIKVLEKQQRLRALTHGALRLYQAA
ncbi:MAG: Smr/MutS family protein [Chloroflexi bacterium]|nr:Smr/MutS family protein [Chloroflexota bacterium]